jgi:tetratricopeptide (TPR) repeat protein
MTRRVTSFWLCWCLAIVGPWVLTLPVLAQNPYNPQYNNPGYNPYVQAYPGAQPYVPYGAPTNPVPNPYGGQPRYMPPATGYNGYQGPQPVQQQPSWPRNYGQQPYAQQPDGQPVVPQAWPSQQPAAQPWGQPPQQAQQPWPSPQPATQPWGQPPQQAQPPWAGQQPPAQPWGQPPQQAQQPWAGPQQQPPAMADDDTSHYSDEYNQAVQDASTAIDQGRLTDGIKLLEKARLIAPEDSMPVLLSNLAAAHIKRGNVFHNKQKQYITALNDFRRAVYYLDTGWPEGLARKGNSDSNLKIARDNLDISYEANKISNADKANHLKMAKALRAEGKFEEAAVEFAQVTRLEPNNTEANKALGQVFSVLNQPDKAKKYFAKAGELDDQSLTQLANAQNQSGDLQKSVETLNQALAINPNNQSALNQLKSIWQNELKMNPNNMVAHANLASVLQKLKQYPDAEREYLIAEDLAQKDAVTPMAIKKQLRLNIGTLYAETNRPDKALEAYNTILQVEQNDPTALLYKATLLGQLGQTNDAMATYTLLLQRDPNNTTARKAAMALLDKQSSDAPVRQFANTLPQDAMVQGAVGELFHRRKQFEPAKEYYLRSLTLKDNQASVYANLGAVYQALNDADNAHKSFQKAAMLDPKNATYQQLGSQVADARQSEQYQQALTLQQQDKFAESLPLLTALVKQAPANADYQASYGVALQQTGKLTEAVAAYDKAIALAPNNAMFHYSLGTARHQMKQYAPAKTAYKKSLALDPTLTDAKEALAMLEKSSATQSLSDATKAYQAKDYKKASILINAAIAQDPNNATAHYYKGLILQAQQQPDSAITSYRKASQVDPTFADAYYAMAVLMDAKKDRTGAKQAYQQYVQKAGSGDSAYLQYAKQRLQAL